MTVSPFRSKLIVGSPSLEEYFKTEIGNTKLAYKSAKVGRDEVSSRCRLLVSGNQTLTSLLDQVESAWHAGSELLNIPTTTSEIRNDIEGTCTLSPAGTNVGILCRIVQVETRTCDANSSDEIYPIST